MEALILLPFFFIVWGSIFFAHRMLEKKMVVNEAARTCAWEQMSGGCTTPRSPRCTYSSGPQLADDDLEGSRAAMDNLQARLTSFVVDFRGMFGATFRPIFGAERESRVNRPRQIGGGDVGVNTSFSEMCNEIPGDETVGGVSSGSFCSITGWCQ